MNAPLTSTAVTATLGLAGIVFALIEGHVKFQRRAESRVHVSVEPAPAPTLPCFTAAVLAASQAA